MTERTIHAGIGWKVAERGEGGDVVLLLHGFPESRRSWKHQLGPLADEGFRAVAPDLPGYGDTERPESADLVTIGALVAELATTLSADGVHLVGHDWGGIVGHAAAHFHPESFRSFTAICSPHPAAFRHVVRDPVQLLRSWYVAAFNVPKLEKLLGARNGAIARRLFAGVESGPLDERRLAGALAYYRENLGPITAFRHDVGTVDVPSLVVHPRRDRFVGRPLIDASARYMTDLRRFEVVDAGHFVQWQRPDELNRILIDFLRSVGDREPSERG